MEQLEEESTQTIPTPNLRPAPKKSPLTVLLPIVIVIILISAGVFSGLVLASRSKNAQLTTGAAKGEELPEEVKQAFAQTFKDEAEGIIEKNDKFEETAQGQWKLVRPGGESQTAYLTSSVLDLNNYVGKKVKVFGETFSSSQVGWLMDVGKVEEIN